MTISPPPAGTNFYWLTRPWFYWPFLFCALALLGTAVWFNASPRVPAYSDFPILYGGARASAQGLSPYTAFIYAPYSADVQFLAAGEGDYPFSKNLNPPAAILLTSPLALLPLRTAYYTNCVLQFILAALVLLKLLPHFGFSRRGAQHVALGLLCLYYPVFANFYVGQIGLYLFILLGLGWLALSRGHFRRAGLWLGLALTYKLFVGLLFIWLLLQRRWLTLCYGALLWCLLQLAALFIYGPQALWDWLQIVADYQGQGISWNLALSGVLHRYLGAGLLQPLYDLPHLRGALYAVVMVSAAFCLLWLNRQSNKIGSTVTADLGYACTIPLMLLLSPVGWLYYYPALLLSAGLIIRHKAGVTHILGLALLSSALPLLLTVGNAFTPDPWQKYQTLSTAQLQLVQDPASLERLAVYVVPELSMLALFLLPLAALRSAYKLRSAQIGA